MQYDVVIVGGGSAGCVLANRLSADSGRRVLLVEAGPDMPEGKIPAALLDSYPGAAYIDKSYTWNRLRITTDPWSGNDPSAARRKVYEQARVMGGGSSINGQLANRGSPDDYDEWARRGAEGWGWDEVQEGGSVKGRVLHPFNAPDFSSYLLRAQSSGAKVVGFANGGGDTINSLKQATEFGLPRGQQMAALLIYISDVHALGLPVAQGTRFADTFYWDMDEPSRTWSKRFMAAFGGRAPTQVHASAYSAVMHYLKAVKAAGTDDGPTVARKMRELPVEDFYTHGAKVRPDGRVVREHFLWQVKTPAESKYPYDYMKLVAKIPGDQLVRPLSQSECPLVKAR